MMRWCLSLSLCFLATQASLVPIVHMSVLASFRQSSQLKRIHATPLHDYVLVEFDAPVATASGLVLPLTSEQFSGRVISVGPGKVHPFTGKHIPMQISTGDKVLFGNYNRQNIVQSNKQLVLLHSENILLKISKSDASVQCLPNTLLVKLQAKEHTTTSGIISSTSEPSVAKVIAIGENMNEATGAALPSDIAVGDNVMLTSNIVGVEVKLRGEAFVVVRYDKVVAKYDSCN